MAFADLGGGKRIYYEEHGPEDGRPILLVHGWCATSSLWSRQIPELVAEGYKVVALDSIGHGRSSKRLVEDISMERIAITLNSFMEVVGLSRKIALVGHSAGGAMAMAAYFRNRERIECLGLLSTGYKMADTLPRQMILPYAGRVVEAAFHPMAKMATRPFVNLFADSFALAYGSDPAEARRWFADVHRTRGRIARMEIDEIQRHDIKKFLHKITVPTLVVGGNHDLLAPGRQSEVLGEEIPNAETHILPMNHLGKMFKSDIVNPILLDFLGRHYPANG